MMPVTGAARALTLSTALLTTVVSLAGCAVLGDTATDVESLEETNKSIVISAVDGLLVNGDESALERYWVEDYKQHNPMAPNGRAILKTLFVDNRPDNFSYQPGLVMASGDFVLMHSRVTGFMEQPAVVVDVFKLEDGKIVEHWDVLQTEVPASESANGNPMFPIEASGDEVSQAEEERNLAIVKAGVQGLLVEGRGEVIEQYWAEDYKQHNPMVPNGRDILAGFFTEGRSDGFSYEPGLYLADGEFVAVHSRVTGFSPQPAIVVDIFRVQDGLITEHWDVFQPETPASESANGNAMFPIE